MPTELTEALSQELHRPMPRDQPGTSRFRSRRV